MDPQSPEYVTLTRCYPTLVSCIELSPSGVAVQLRPSKILSQEDRSFVNNTYECDYRKAVRIVDVVQNQVGINPQVFSIFVSALEAAGEWTASTVALLECTLLECTRQSQASVIPPQVHSATDHDESSVPGEPVTLAC